MSHKLPGHLTRFIGRRREIAEVRQRLAETRLITLTGPGGIGKTRLAAEAARQSGDEGASPVVWVDLAALSEGALVPKTVAAALGMPEQPDRPVREGLANFLAAQQRLLVLDNCEHLATDCSALVQLLLQRCPQVRFLVTSLQPLGLGGEMLYPVPALALPASTALAELATGGPASAAALEQLQATEAISLFVDRAAAVLPGFALTPANAPAIAEICLRLDGLPLAIELAAAWVHVLAVEQIAARLDDRFSLLAAGQSVGVETRPGVEARHQTLRATIDWAFVLLAPEEQALLRRLSVFAAGCSLDTADAVCTGDGIASEQLLPLLAALVQKSLVAADTHRPGNARYRLLETIRQYAAEKLDATAEAPGIRERFLHCFLQRVEETEPKLRGPYQELWLNWLAEEYGNVRAALRLSLETGQIEAGLRMAIVFFQFWTIRDYVEEGLAWLEQLLAQADETVSPLVRANALAYASVLAGRRGHAKRQVRYGEEATRLGQEAGEEGKQALAIAVGALAWVALKAGDYQAAFTLGQREIELRRQTGDLHTLGVTLTIFSFMAMAAGQFTAAHAVLDEGLPLLRKAGNPYRLAMALNYAGDLARCEADYDRAQAAYEESLALLRQIEAVRDQASVLHNLGHTCLHLGDVAAAEALFTESLALHQAQENRPGMGECLLGFAALALAREQPLAGTRLLAAAAALQPLRPEWVATYREYEQLLARAQASLTAQAFQREQAAGRRLSLEGAIASAQAVAREAAAGQRARRQRDELTPREREVAILVAQARSNGEIAEELVVSRRTVEKHIANILAKLGLSTRSQMMRWALESGLVDASGPPRS